MPLFLESDETKINEFGNLSEMEHLKCHRLGSIHPKAHMTSPSKALQFCCWTCAKCLEELHALLLNGKMTRKLEIPNAVNLKVQRYLVGKKWEHHGKMRHDTCKCPALSCCFSSISGSSPKSQSIHFSATFTSDGLGLVWITSMCVCVCSCICHNAVAKHGQQQTL